MSLTFKKLPKLVFFLKIIVLGFFLINVGSLAHRLYSYYESSGNDTIWVIGFNWSTFLSYFSAVLLVSIHMIGILFKQRIALTLNDSYFYFLRRNLGYHTLSDLDAELLLQLLIYPFFGLIFCFMIFLVNRREVYNYYQISRSQLLSMNIVAFTIGMFLSLLIAARDLF
jgi:hypothetical protein